MLESPIPSTKIVILSSPEYHGAFQRGSLNSFLPRETRSNQVTPLPSTVTRKYRKSLRRVRPSMIWPLCLSLTPTPSSTAPLSLLFMIPPCFHYSKAPNLRAFALAILWPTMALPLIFQWLAPSCLSYPSTVFSEEDTIQRSLPISHAPSPLCFNLLSALIMTGYFLVHLLCFGGGFVTVVCHLYFYPI